jgi:uncharacterized protein YjbI with pentapeptide repeats
MELPRIKKLRKKISAVAIAALIPLTGAWFTFWERNQADREFRRQHHEGEVKKHHDFIQDISNLILQDKFGYLKNWTTLDRWEIKRLTCIEREELRPNGKDSKEESTCEQAPTIEIPALSSVYGTKLLLLLEGGRLGRKNYQEDEDLRRVSLETLNFLWRNRLLGSGGLLSGIGGGDFTDLDLSSANLACTDVNTRLRRTKLRRANLDAVNLFGQEAVEDSDFSESSLEGGWLAKRWIKTSDFSNATLRYASLARSKLEANNFKNADMKNAILFLAKLADDNNFEKADLRGAILTFDVANSKPGKLFKGGYANSKPTSLDNGTIIEATLIPKGMTFKQLGLHDTTARDGAHPNPKDQATTDEPKAEAHYRLELIEQCKYRLDAVKAMAQVYRDAASSKLNSTSRTKIGKQ